MADLQRMVEYNENKYKNLFENSHIGLWEEDASLVKIYIEELKQKGIVDFRTYFKNNPLEVRKCIELIRVIDVNKQILKFYNFTDKNLFINNLMSFVNENSFHFFEEEILAFIDGAKVFEYESIRKTVDGKKINSYTNVSITMEAENDWSRILVSVIDITALKQREEELHRQTILLNEIFETMQEGIGLIDENEIVLYCNPAFAHIFETDAHQLLQNSIHHYLDNENITLTLQQTEQRKKGFTSTYDLKINTALNNERLIHVKASPRRDTNGEFIGSLVTIFDITEDINQKNALKVNKALLENTTDTIPAFIAVVDAKTLIYKFVNKKYQDSFQHERSKIIGSHISKVIGKENTEIAMKYIDEVRQGKTTSYINTFNLSEGIRYINVSFTPSFNQQGEVQDIIVLSYDITDIKEAEISLRENESKLQELNATKDKLFSIIGHDLKTPLNNIMGFAELIFESLDSSVNNKIVQYHKHIYEAATSMSKLLENLLQWANSQRKVTTVYRENINLNVITHQCVELLRLAANAKNISIKNEVTKNCAVFADKDMITTVLRNILQNAIKFTNSGGEITISSEMKEENCKITVTDNGIGIKTELHDKIFSVAPNLTTIGTANERGTGLGLLICKEFIEQNKGNLWVESEVGKGSKFHFELPITTEIEDNQSVETSTYTVLIAEDEILNFILLKEHIKNMSQNIHIIHATNGVDAVEFCKTNAVDLIFMDINLPKLDGNQATRQILEMFPHLPIVAQSAYTNSENKQKAFSSGCSDFISKPISRQVLTRIVNKYLLKI